MDFMDTAFVGYYSHIEEERERDSKLKVIARYLKDNGETNDNLNDICQRLSITELPVKDMQKIKYMVNTYNL